MSEGGLLQNRKSAAIIAHFALVGKIIILVTKNYRVALTFLRPPPKSSYNS